MKNYPAFKEMGLDTRKPVLGVCEQQRHIPDCPSVQSDQCLNCYSLIGKYYIKTCFKQHFNFQASLCNYAEQDLVRNSENRFSNIIKSFSYELAQNTIQKMF